MAQCALFREDSIKQSQIGKPMGCRIVLAADLPIINTLQICLRCSLGCNFQPPPPPQRGGQKARKIARDRKASLSTNWPHLVEKFIEKNISQNVEVERFMATEE